MPTSTQPIPACCPGYVAGHYTYDDVHIDLVRLAMFAGARFINADVTGILRDKREIVLRGRPSIRYDRLSINIGSTPQWNQVPGAQEHAVPVKPIFQFNQRWLALLERVRQQAGSTTIAVVGAGAGGVELTLAMQYRLREELRLLGRDPDTLQMHLFTAGDVILPTHNAGVRRRFDAALQERRVQVHRNSAVEEVAAGRLRAASGKWVDADEIVWVTRAGGAAWLRATGLALDDEASTLRKPSS